MIHIASAAEALREKFGERRFSAREAAEALPFTVGTTFVALSSLVRAGILGRVKKGVYVLKPKTSSTVSVEQLRRPEFKLPEGSYATATYALANTLSPLSAPNYMDIFVRPSDYSNAIALEMKAFPQPRVHPFAIRKAPLRKSIDGLPVTHPEIALVDLLKIAIDKRRPVSLEFEVLPFIPQLAHRWSKVVQFADHEGIREYLEAILTYVELVARESGIRDVELPEPHSIPRKGPPRTLRFSGVRIDRASILTWRRTGVLIEADGGAVRSVLENL